tara:strand:- start:246 stop:485 length:240 start_codon:yes stop_codon:yes gene_type:complete
MMEFNQYLDFAKVTYCLYLEDIISESEAFEYLWDADSDVIQFSDEEIVTVFRDDRGILSTITINSELMMWVESNYEGYE